MRKFPITPWLALILISCGDTNVSTEPVADTVSSPNGILAADFADSGIDLDLAKLENNVRIFLVDAPIDNALSVKVTLEELSIHRVKPNEEWVKVDLKQKEYDLLALKDGPSGILGDIDLEPGTYDLIRLKVIRGEISLKDGATHALCIPENGRKNHIQLKIDLLIPEEHTDEAAVDQAIEKLGNAEETEVEEDAFGVVVDFDVAESIKERAATDKDIEEGDCTYVLRPMLKLKRAAKLFKEKRKVKRKVEALKNRFKRAKERIKNRDHKDPKDPKKPRGPNA